MLQRKPVWIRSDLSITSPAESLECNSPPVIATLPCRIATGIYGQTSWPAELRPGRITRHLVADRTTIRQLRRHRRTRFIRTQSITVHKTSPAAPNVRAAITAVVPSGRGAASFIPSDVSAGVFGHLKNGPAGGGEVLDTFSLAGRGGEGGG